MRGPLLGQLPQHLLTHRSDPVGLGRLSDHRSHGILFGAVGWPATVPDHVSLWGSLLKFRREFDQYVNLRPARLMPGVRSALVDRDGQARQDPRK